MVKKTSKGGGGRKGGESSACWSSNHHAIRKANQQRKRISEKLEERERRSALLTRDSKQKRAEGKNRLHIKRTQRMLEKLRERLENWDDVAEEEMIIKEEEERIKAKERLENPVKKGRKGPETWKLKGAARPAHLVYDFDTRYIDPHLKAHEEARIKTSRCRNILVLCKGKFGIENDKDVPQPYCREYLSLLMQLGNLCMHSHKIKTARNCFMDSMELDSSAHPITPARCQLMRLYLEANRPDSARRLWEKLSPTDPSVWIRYSAVLVEFVSFKILEEDGSSEQKCEDRLIDAIKSNIFCAYYLAFFDDFNEVMEYTDEIEDANDASPLEQAIEYCNSEQVGAWKGTDGAMDWVRNFIVRNLNSKPVSNKQNLSASDLDWREALSKIRMMHDAHDTNKNAGDDDKSSSSDDESIVDIGMYANMFETAMEMLEDSGDFNTAS